MALTPEEAARQVMAVIVKKHGVAVGDTVTGMTIALAFDEENLDPHDMQPGMQYAIDEGWLELTPKPSLRLTAKGHAATR